jgi:hypothetical protein
MKHFIYSIIAVSLFLLPLCKGVPTVFAQAASSSGIVTNAALGDWVHDPMTTFLGKAANRAESFMNWMLVNYKWDYLDTSLINAWSKIRNIVYAISLLAVVVTAFFIIINGGRNVGILIFTREFILALLLVTFSFALARFLYQIADIFQAFFFQTAGTSSGIIVGRDVVNISFGSQDFIGFRKAGVAFDESAFISLLLIQLSSVTFYVIGSILTVRKIILWFFLISAPLYPIVLLYKPIKNTAKIWISEFIRWLLYAPLFIMFLAAVVIIWKSNILILPFNFTGNPPLYPTAISILVGGPGQQLSLANSLNHTDTFVQYVVALLMLWVAILMPFIILQLLLDFLEKYDFGLNPMTGYMNALQTRVANNDFSFLKKPPGPVPLPVAPYATGTAREIPRQVAVSQSERQGVAATTYTQTTNVTNQQQTTNQSQQTNVTNRTENTQQTTHVSQQQATTVQLKPEIASTQTTRLVNFPIPTMRDIVSFETARLSRVQVTTFQLQQTEKTLEKIANPKTSTTPAEVQHFTTLREQLSQETTKGDILAKSILTAASAVQKPQVGVIPVINLPVVNRIQTVSFDDYEAVKSLWEENYQQIDVPAKYMNRKAWIEDDGTTVSQVVTLLSSPDPMKVREGLSSVSNILPFLLIGGFSQTEVIAYLKAKGAAGKLALEELAKKEEEQETLVAKGAKKQVAKELHAEVEPDKKEGNN